MTATNIQQANLHMAAQSSAAVMERVIIAGDLGQLQPAERVQYYRAVCDSVGLNPLTKPFEYIELNGKLTLYALKTTTDQLRQINRVSVSIVSREMLGDAYVVTARATTPDGRTDESIGAVPLAKDDGEWKPTSNGKKYFAKNGKTVALSGEEYTNALMKAETKAKRRVTLSICGLGWLDESEVGSVPSAGRVKVDMETGEVQQEAGLKPSEAKALEKRRNVLKEMGGEERQIDPRIEAARQKVHEMAARVAKVAPSAEVQDIINSAGELETTADELAEVYQSLVALGKRYAPKVEQVKSDTPAEDAAPWQEPASEPETVPAIPMASKEQIGQLQAAAKSMGADTSEKRAALWGWLLKHEAPCTTKSLSEEEAAWLLNLLSKPDATPENRAKWFTAALKAFPATTEDK